MVMAKRQTKKKTWIYIKVGLFRDPKHRRELGEAIWLYGHLIDIADWDTGVVDEFKDQECADEMAASISWVRKHRRRLEEKGYIKINQLGQQGQRITLVKWTNPRSYDGAVLNDEQGDTNATPINKNQSDTQSDRQSDTQSIPSVPLSQVQNEYASNIPYTNNHKDSADAIASQSNPPAEKPKSEKTRDLLFEAVLLGSFGITYISGMSLPKNTAGRVSKLSKALREVEVTPDELAAYYADFKARNPNLTPVQSETKLPLEVLGYREKRKGKPEAIPPSQRKFVPEVVKPLTDEERVEVLRKMKEARHGSQAA
jgi:hypothetical protein